MVSKRMSSDPQPSIILYQLSRGSQMIAKDPLVEAWLGGYPPNTRRIYLLLLRDALEDDDPKTVLAMDEALRMRIVARARKARDLGKNRWAQLILTAVKSYCASHGVEVQWRRAERIKGVLKKIHSQHVPSRSEVYHIAEMGGIRGRAMVLCLYQSGVRVNCLSRWDMRLVGGVLGGIYNGKQNGINNSMDCPIPYPLRITSEYDSKISSYGLAYYYTFLGTEAVEALRDHLNYRVLRGWTPKPTSNVWGNILYPSRETGQSTHNVWEIVKKATEKAGLPRDSVWTHLFRKSFQKALNQAAIDEDTKESLMGHVLPGSRGNYFDYHDVDEIRDKYVKVPLSREAPAEVNGLRETVEELKRSNLELKLDMVLREEKYEAVRNEFQRRDHEVHAGLIETISRLEKKVQELEKQPTTG